MSAPVGQATHLLSIVLNPFVSQLPTHAEELSHLIHSLFTKAYPVLHYETGAMHVALPGVH